MSTMTFPDRASWLAERKQGLGASDVSAALGINPWKSRFALWAEKCDLLADEDLAAEVEAVDWGLTLEQPIARKFGERTGRKVHIPPEREMYVHSDLPFLRATPDALQDKPHVMETGDLQIKTTSAFMAGEWKDGATPLMYQVQVQFELFVTGLPWGSIACLVGGQKLLWRDIEPDTAFVESAIPHLERFWDHVETRTPPEIDASPATARVLQKLHPDDNGMTVDLSDDSMEWHTELLAVKEKIKALEELKRLNENRLKAVIGDATFGQMPNGERYSLKTQTKAAHEVKESTFRVLRKTKG